MMNIRKYILLSALAMLFSGCIKNTTSIHPITLPTDFAQIPSIAYTPTPTLWPAQLLSSADIEKDLEGLLRTNGNCGFPCFWNIHPNETNSSQVTDLFMMLGENGYSYQRGEHSYKSTTFAFKKTGRVYLQLDIQDEIVRNIEVTLDGLWHAGIQSGDWSAYNLNQILERYSAPTSVELYLSPLAEGGTSYGIKLIYKDLATSVLYDGATKDEISHLSSGMKVCPATEISSAKMDFGKTPINPEPNGVPLSDATNLNIAEFYRLFTLDSDACFTMNLRGNGMVTSISAGASASRPLRCIDPYISKLLRYTY